MLKRIERPTKLVVGGLVVILDENGIRLRPLYKKSCIKVSYDQLALLGLRNLGVKLSERERDEPTELLGQLPALKRRQVKVLRKSK